MTNDEPVKPRHIPVLTRDERETAGKLMYQLSLYNGTRLRTFSRIMSKALWGKTTHVISGGSSACVLASSIILRKPKLTHLFLYPSDTIHTHRGAKTKVASGYVGDGQHVAFVDDLLDSGATARSVFLHYTKYFSENELSQIKTMDFYFFKNYGGKEGIQLLRDTLRNFPHIQSMIFCLREEECIDISAQN